MSVDLTSVIQRRLVTNAVLARLQELDTATVYDAEIPGTVPLIQTNAETDPSGRVAPYAVLYPLPGSPSGDVDLADTHFDLDLDYQVSAVTGYRQDCEHLVDQIDALLYRWAPTVDGLECGWLRPPPGFRPGPIRPVNSERPGPARFWVPLQYRLRVTR